MAEPPDIRIGTAEREEAVALLGEHFAAGRLTVAEFDQRVTRANRALTRGDLLPLFADLPSAPGYLMRPSPRDTAADLMTLVPFVVAALLVLLVFRHPVAILLALTVLGVVGMRGYRIVNGLRAP